MQVYKRIDKFLEEHPRETYRKEEVYHFVRLNLIGYFRVFSVDQLLEDCESPESYYESLCQEQGKDYLVTKGEGFEITAQDFIDYINDIRTGKEQFY